MVSQLLDDELTKIIYFPKRQWQSGKANMVLGGAQHLVRST